MTALSVADDQLRSFFERWSRLNELRAVWDSKRPFNADLVAALANRPHHLSVREPGPRGGHPFGKAGVSTSEASAMLALCEWLTRIGRASDDEPEERRGYMIACRLTGLSWREVQRAIGDVSQVGADEAGVLWSGRMGPPDVRFIGRVYTATTESDPSTVKIGFSTDVKARALSLARLYGERMVIKATIPGTMLHEWAIHQIIFRPVAPEWYRASDVPDWLLNTPSSQPSSQASAKADDAHPLAASSADNFEPPAFLRERAYVLRPHCLRPDNCGSYGAKHCGSCERAARESEAA